MAKENNQYYSCEYLLTLKDKNGNLPDIYICDGNRTAGKSVSFKKHTLDKWFRKSSNDINQFIALYRNKYEITGCSASYFDDMKRLYYHGHEMTEKKIADGIAMQLIMDGEVCGFAVPLSMSTKLKRMSALFSRVAHMFFDEYQDDNGKYLPDEIGKLMSIHTNVARGDGAQSRRVPLYMASNTISMLNPYYSALGIDKMLKHETKILRGEGWVLERTFNKSASEAFQGSAFNKAFSDMKYFSHASENVYLNDNTTLIDKPKGLSKYECSIKYNNEWFNIRKYENLMYVDEGADQGYPFRICFNVDDVTDDRVVMLGRSNYFIIMYREWFMQGKMRFKNLKCKNMILDMLAFI